MLPWLPISAFQTALQMDTLQSDTFGIASYGIGMFQNDFKYRIEILDYKICFDSSWFYPGLIKMRSRLGTQFMAFFQLIARILTFCDKKYRILAFRDKKYRILTFRDKKYRILTFRDKTESYLTVLQQNNAEAC